MSEYTEHPQQGDPWDTSNWPDRGVLYVRQPGTGVILRFNVAVGIVATRAKDIVFSGVNVGPVKLVPTAAEN